MPVQSGERTLRFVDERHPLTPEDREAIKLVQFRLKHQLQYLIDQMKPYAHLTHASSHYFSYYIREFRMTIENQIPLMEDRLNRNLMRGEIICSED